MRLKELQKNRLMAVHDALVVVLEEMKASGEVSVHCLATMGLTHKNSFLKALKFILPILFIFLCILSI